MTNPLMIDSDWRTTIPRTPPPGGVLLCPPRYFDVVDVKNAFMRDQQGRVDRERAAHQWQDLADTYRRLGVPVHLLEPVPGCEDMVFCANVVSVLPRAEGGADIVLSRMRHPSRQAEVPHAAAWFEHRGYSPLALPPDSGVLEGHGDVLVVPGRHLALAGFGGRSEARALAALQRLTGLPLVPLRLPGSVFYHLDTALAVLDEDTLLVHPPALSAQARQTLRPLFPRLLEADPDEARQHLAVNVHALPGGRVVVPAQARRTADVLARAGYEPELVDVSEFHLSGGSVFCMRLDLPPGLPPPA